MADNRDIYNRFQEEVKEAYFEFLSTSDCDDGAIDEAEQFLEEAYNTIPLTEYECSDFINNDLRCYLDMEKFCKDYYEDELGEVWTGRGLVKVVGLWKYLYATDYIKGNVEDLVQEFLDKELPS
jgi:hypothetical protein